MGRLVQLLVVDVLVGLVFLFGVMILVGGLRWSDIRAVLLYGAYSSFAFEGERIPGRSPGLAARLAIRLLSDPDDGRLALVPEVRFGRRVRPILAYDRLELGVAEIRVAATFRAR
jgi:hypothetical protein